MHTTYRTMRRVIAFASIGVTLMPVKIIDDSFESSVEIIAAGVVWAAENGADVIGMSIGVPYRFADTPELVEVLHSAIVSAVNVGVIVVAASGNAGDSLQYPAAFPEAIAVGATSFSQERALYSNYGPGLDEPRPNVKTEVLTGLGNLFPR